MGLTRRRRFGWTIGMAVAGSLLVIGAVATYVVASSSGPASNDTVSDMASIEDSAPTSPSLSATVATTPAAASSAVVSPSVSARSTKTVAPAAPRAGGKPGPANTGVPPGTALTVVAGDVTYSTAGAVISGMDIRGFVHIRAANVTIKNSIIRGRPNPPCNSALIAVAAGGSATIVDTEVSGDYPGPCLDGVSAQNTTLTRVNIHGTVDGVKAGNNVVMRDSYVHDMSYFASDPNQGGGPTHNDAVQSFEGNQHITLSHNTMNPGPKGNAALQVTQDGSGLVSDMHIDGNWVDGGGCTLNFAHKKAPMTGIFVTNNRFGRGSVFDCPILLSTQTTLSQLSGNVWDDTGAPIPAPQRHD